MTPGYDFTWIIWLFFLLLMLQPVIAQKALEGTRRRLMASIEEKRNSRVIVLIHRQETISFFGIPLFRFLNMEDSEEILRALYMTDPRMNVDIVLHTPGGLVLAAVQIARAIKRRKGKTTAIVPHYAMSGGTLIALAADEIVMSPDAVLGPLDPQINGLPAPSIVNLRRLKPADKITDQWLVLADISAKAMGQMQDVVFEILQDKMPEEKAREFARMLTSGVWTHDRPITAQELKQWGLNVTTEIPEEFMKLMALYKQPYQRRQSAVDYIPEPHTNGNNSTSRLPWT